MRDRCVSCFLVGSFRDLNACRIDGGSEAGELVPMNVVSEIFRHNASEVKHESPEAALPGADRLDVVSPDASLVFWPDDGCAASSPFEEVGPTVVLQVASDSEQGAGSGLRPVAPGPLEAAADDLLASAFHDA